jgi:hypothetical protein
MRFQMVYLIFSNLFIPKINSKNVQKRRKKTDEKREKTRIFWESYDESVFVVLEFYFETQMQFKMFIQSFAENFTDYPNMWSHFSKCFSMTIVGDAVHFFVYSKSEYTLESVSVSVRPSVRLHDNS